MSAFDTQYEGAFAGQFCAELGDPNATYQPPGGTTAATGLTLTLRRGPAAVVSTADGAVSLNEVSATIDVAESEGVTPQRDGAFGLGGETWVIVDPPYLEGGVWRCFCRSRTRHSAGERRTRT